MQHAIYETQSKDLGAQVLDVRHIFIGQKSVYALGIELMLLPQQAQLVEKVVINEMTPTARPRFISHRQIFKQMHLISQ